VCKPFGTSINHCRLRCTVHPTTPVPVTVLVFLMSNLTTFKTTRTTLTLHGHIKSAKQRTTIHDWYTGRWWVHGLLHLVQRGGPGLAPLLAVPNVTNHSSTISVPTSYYFIWHYNCLCTLELTGGSLRWEHVYNFLAS